MSDAERTCVDVTLSAGLVVKFASLPAMVALKLVAWGARNSYTDKDADDLALLLDASHSGIFEDQCWADDSTAAHWDYEPALVGPYRLGEDIVGTFADTSVGRLIELLSGVELDRLTSRMPRRGVPRAQQLEALKAALGGAPVR